MSRGIHSNFLVSKIHRRTSLSHASMLTGVLRERMMRIHRAHIHYSIEWKITVNNRAIMPKDTEQDLVLEPAAYWEHFLEPKLKNVFKKNRPLRSEDTTVVVSVTERSERDLTKRFDETNIDWAIIKKQLVAWGELFRVGKKLRLILSFNYVDTSQSSTALLRGPNQRCRSSTTNQMLTERAAQLDAKESSGQPSIWREVYNLMRCPGPPCDLGPYCWCDPDGKKHYKHNTHHLRSLIRYLMAHYGNLEACQHDVYIIINFDMCHTFTPSRFNVRKNMFLVFDLCYWLDTCMQNSHVRQEKSCQSEKTVSVKICVRLITYVRCNIVSSNRFMRT
jgi:hypothetical protein